MSRIVEAYLGEFASGKSEVAINRALDLKRQNRIVTLVDLDIVEPFYTIRPLKRELEALGLQVIGWETAETKGLGEAGNLLKPAMKWVLRREGDIILDIGYGVEGAKTLNLVEEKDQYPELKIFVVLNIARPMTSDLEEVVQYIQTLGPVHGLINNTHLGSETDLTFVEQGSQIITEAARRLNLNVIATTVDHRLQEEMGSVDSCGNPVRLLHRYMDRSFW